MYFYSFICNLDYDVITFDSTIYFIPYQIASRSEGIPQLGASIGHSLAVNSLFHAASTVSGTLCDPIKSVIIIAVLYTHRITLPSVPFEIHPEPFQRLVASFIEGNS